MARTLVEELIGEDLYPVTCSDGRLSASCDGLTMGEDIAFEHKQWNQALAASISAGQLPDEYMPQPQQIMMVTGCSKVIFVCSDGTRDNFVYLWVLPDPAWQARIRDGWTRPRSGRSCTTMRSAQPTALKAGRISARPARVGAASG